MPMKSLNENDQKPRTGFVREHHLECSWNLASFSLNMSDISQLPSFTLDSPSFLCVRHQMYMYLYTCIHAQPSGLTFQAALDCCGQWG
jgi:hypothetical protein